MAEAALALDVASRLGTVRRLRGAAVAALAGLPLAASLANRSGPLVLGVAAVLALAAALAEDGRSALDALIAPLRGALGAALAALLAWSLVSLAWAPVPGSSARALAEFALALAGSLVLARCLGPRLDARAVRLGGLGLAAGAVVVLASLASDLAPQRLAAGLGVPAPRLFPEIFNRGALTLVVLAPPLVGLLARDGRHLGALIVAGLAAAAALRSQSLTAALAGLVAAGTFAAAQFLPARLSLAAARAGLLAGLVLAPLAGDLLARGMPEAAHRLLWSGNSAGRVAIARSFGAAVRADPWRGMGFGASPRADETPAAAGVEPELRLMLRAGHPHDAALQVWAELGIVGAGLAALVLLLAIEALATPDRAILAPRLALLAAVAAAALVGHGAWQAWWAAAIGAAATWLAAPSPAVSRLATPAMGGSA